MAVRSELTLEAFLRLEETKPAQEFACGEVIQKPMPDVSHSRIQMYLGAVLFQFLSQTGLGWVLPELRCIFGPPGRERAFVPDLSYVARERLPAERHLHRAPDLAIEILSPDQNMARFVDKVQFYLLHGVRMVWVIDPAATTVAVLVPGDEARTLTAGDVLDGGEVLPGFSLFLDDVFAQIPSRANEA